MLPLCLQFCTFANLKQQKTRLLFNWRQTNCKQETCTGFLLRRPWQLRMKTVPRCSVVTIPMITHHPVWHQMIYNSKKKILLFLWLDLDPMTLIYDFHLDILKLYLHTKNKLSMSRISKVTALQTDRQTHKQMQLKTLPGHICRW